MSKVSTELVIGEVRFSYAHVWEPNSINGDTDNAKYSVSILIPKTDKKTLAKVKDAIDLAINNGLASKFGGKNPSGSPSFKYPLRDGDAERPDDPVYAGHMFVNASNKNAPHILKAVPGAQHQPIFDKTEFYSGCYGYAHVNFYAFNTSGNKGVACSLQNLLKTRDGEPLGGGMSAENAFDGIEVEAEDWEN